MPSRAPRSRSAVTDRANAAPGSPASSYATGAPNIAGGPPVAPTMASQMTVSGQDLNNRPVTRPGEILEAAPGLAVVMHADGGKANQYYLRGYNLDHGTDLAFFVDDMPINLPTHAHGQGYADLNWLMPETVNSLDIRKGPYFADVGDFASAGSLFVNLERQCRQEDSRGDRRQFRLRAVFHHGIDEGSAAARCSMPARSIPTTARGRRRTKCSKLSGLLRYSQGTATDGFSVSAMAYDNTWNSTDQIPLRAITTG